ncbi:hypothetical protein K7432_003832 [Basidiobolus ranarum]
MNKIKLLRSFGIKPLLVFDGGLLPSKLTTEFDRSSSRSANRSKAIALYNSGKKTEAMDYFQKCVDITPQMAYQLIKSLQEEEVEFIVAPYEADAQLAYLDKIGRVSGVITEDSDLLVYGCKCVILKLDHQGNAIEIRVENLQKMNSVFSGWSHSQFRQMCILSGCDYLKSIPGMGLKTAHKYFQKYHVFERVIRILRLEGSLKIPVDYEQKFQRAELTFLHQQVYCPEAMGLVPLNPIEEGLDLIIVDFIGKRLSSNIAKDIATGIIDPISLEPYVEFETTVTQKNKITNQLNFFTPKPRKSGCFESMVLKSMKGSTNIHCILDKSNSEPRRTNISSAKIFSKSTPTRKSKIITINTPERSAFFKPVNTSKHLETSIDSGLLRLDEQMNEILDNSTTGGVTESELESESIPNEIENNQYSNMLGNIEDSEKIFDNFTPNRNSNSNTEYYFAANDSPTPVRTRTWSCEKSIAPTTAPPPLKEILSVKRCITDLEVETEESDFDRSQHRLQQVAKSLRAKFARTECDSPSPVKRHASMTLDSEPKEVLTRSKSTLGFDDTNVEKCAILNTDPPSITAYDTTPRTPIRKTKEIAQLCGNSPILVSSSQKLENFRFKAKA